MGSVLSGPGVQAGVLGVSPSPLPGVKAPKRSSKRSLASSGPRPPLKSRGDYGGASPGARTRILFKSICSPEAQRRCKTNTGSKSPKPLPKDSLFPNGIYSFGSGRPTRERIPRIYRYQGCIPARPDLSRAFQVSPICSGTSAFSVRGLALRASHGPSGFHKNSGPSSGQPKISGDPGYGLFRRSYSDRSLRGQSEASSRPSGNLPGISGLDPKSGQIGLTAHKKIGISWADSRYCASENLSSPVQGGFYKGANSSNSKQRKADRSSVYAPIGQVGGDLRSGALRPNPLSKTTESNSRSLGQENPGPGFSHIPVTCSSSESVLVAGPTKPFEGKVVQSRFMEDCDYRRESFGVGRSPGRIDPAREVVKSRIDPVDKCSGDTSNPVGSSCMDRCITGLPCEDTVRQRHGCGLHKPPGRHQESSSPEGGGPDLCLGRDPCSLHLSSVYPRGGQLAGGFPQPPSDVSGRMVPPSRGISGHLPKMGSPGGGHNGLQIQYEVDQVRVTDKGSIGLRDGHPGMSLASVCTDLRLPSVTDATPSSSQNSGGAQTNDSSSTRVAPEALVLLNNKDGSRRTLGPPVKAGPPLTRTVLPSCLTGPKFDGLAAESLILRNRGLSGRVIPTLINARKPVSSLYTIGCGRLTLHGARLRDGIPASMSLGESWNSYN